MDKLSDADLSWLRGHCTAMGLSAYPERRATWEDLVAVIDELRERRAADNFTPGYYPEMVCPKCKLNTIRYNSGEFMFKGFRCTNCDWTATEYAAMGCRREHGQG